MFHPYHCSSFILKQVKASQSPPGPSQSATYVIFPSHPSKLPTYMQDGCTNHDQLLILGLVIPVLIGNPCINPYYKVDDHPYHRKTMGVSLHNDCHVLRSHLRRSHFGYESKLGYQKGDHKIDHIVLVDLFWGVHQFRTIDISVYI